jgi:hypothetical protein
LCAGTIVVVVVARSSASSRGSIDDDRARDVPTRVGADAARDDFMDAYERGKRERRASDEVRTAYALEGV